MSVSFDPDVIEASSDAASSALLLAGANSNAASMAFDKAAAASSRIAARSAAWEHTSGLRSVRIVTDTYTILDSDDDIVCSKATAFTVTLPGGGVGRMRNIKNIGVGTVTIAGAGSVTIDDISAQDLYQGEAMQLECSAANKWVIV